MDGDACAEAAPPVEMTVTAATGIIENLEFMGAESPIALLDGIELSNR